MALLPGNHYHIHANLLKVGLGLGFWVEPFSLIQRPEDHNGSLSQLPYVSQSPLLADIKTTSLVPPTLGKTSVMFWYPCALGRAHAQGGGFLEAQQGCYEGWTHQDCTEHQTHSSFCHELGFSLGPDP